MALYKNTKGGTDGGHPWRPSERAAGIRHQMPTVYQDERPAHVQFPNTATEAVLHNHDYQDTSRGNICYQGYSLKNPSYHLFVCIAHSKPPRNKNLHLQPYERLAFTPESKAGRGGCSMRGCHEEAVNMNERGTKAYCARCSDRSTNTVPCPWTSIVPCTRVQSWGEKTCTTCDNFEEVPNENLV